MVEDYFTISSALVQSQVYRNARLEAATAPSHFICYRRHMMFAYRKDVYVSFWVALSSLMAQRPHATSIWNIIEYSYDAAQGSCTNLCGDTHSISLQRRLVNQKLLVSHFQRAIYWSKDGCLMRGWWQFPNRVWKWRNLYVMTKDSQFYCQGAYLLSV
jgi:hypothetical protein